MAERPRRRRRRHEPAPVAEALARFRRRAGGGGGGGAEAGAAALAWPDVVGAAAAAHSVPLRRSRAGVLTVACSSAAWASADDPSFATTTRNPSGSSVRVRLACDEACEVRARGIVSTARARKSARYRLSGATAKLGARVKTTLRLKISNRKRKRIRRALRKRRRATAKVTIVAKDGLGNARTVRRNIKLRR